LAPPDDDDSVAVKLDASDSNATTAQSERLRVEVACGIHSAALQNYSDFVDTGVSCTNATQELNTFALRVSGPESEQYSAVVRCGYIRYDNGTFVGERVVVEARDGQWCHELALERIELRDRMLLTDVAFVLERLERSAAPHSLSMSMLSRAGWSDETVADQAICMYVAHHQAGAYACRLGPTLDYCTCPPGESWEDFMEGVAISLDASGDAPIR
jgi:hypothetical protein